MSGSWLVAWHPLPASVPVLLCLPQAGSGCGQFRELQRRLGSGVSVIGVQLPGRESRWSEPMPSDVDSAVDAITKELADLIGRAPLTIFGHSFGGTLGYEIARRRPPATLVVAASRPPHQSGSAPGSIGDQLSDETLARMFTLGTDDLDEESREILLEPLRKDARLSATYRDPGGAKVSCDLEAWSGTDDETVTSAHAEAWRDYGAVSFRHREFVGGHDFWMASADLVVPVLGELVANSAKERI